MEQIYSKSVCKYRQVLLALALCISLIAASGPAPAQQAAPPTTSTPRLADVYKISSDDYLEIYIIDVPEYSRPYRVGPDGTISLPLLNEPIMAAGKTTAELGDVIAKELKNNQLLKNPQILVEVKQSREHAIAVTGAVNTPQLYSLIGHTTLLALLSQAGGLADDASDQATVKQGEIGSRMMPSAAGQGGVLPVDLKKLFSGDDSQNLTVYPGDSVVVHQAALVYVVGAVNHAGGFVMSGERNRISTLQAIALAWGVSTTANLKKAVIIRKDATSKVGGLEVPIDLKKILANQSPDSFLVANDILYVPDSTAKRLLHRAGDAVAQSAALVSAASVYR